jgi:hypothetical protein
MGLQRSQTKRVRKVVSGRRELGRVFACYKLAEFESLVNGPIRETTAANDSLDAIKTRFKNISRIISCFSNSLVIRRASVTRALSRFTMLGR